MTGKLALSSEFATVHVWVDTEGNGPRLLVEDQHNGRRIYLDPLELASLTWLRHADLGPFLDPSRTGWRDDGGAPADLAAADHAGGQQ
jgi:hypothetical protein